MRSCSKSQIGITTLSLFALFLISGCLLTGALQKAPTETLPPNTTPQATRVARLDDETLQRLTLSLEKSIQLKPGDTYTFSVGTMECCVYFKPLAVDVDWSVIPSDGASIDPQTGVFSVDADTPAGSKYTVTGNVLDGRATPSIDVYIYTRETSPLVGTWGEKEQLACDTGQARTPQMAIEELIFKADQTFSVTWMPFEIYKDYWGTYTYDPVSQALSLEIGGGNYVPDDFAGKGKAHIDEQGRLILDGIWLGSRNGETSLKACGHSFVRLR